MILNEGDIVKKVNFDDIVFTEINKKGYLLIHAFKRNKSLILKKQLRERIHKIYKCKCVNIEDRDKMNRLINIRLENDRMNNLLSFLGDIPKSLESYVYDNSNISPGNIFKTREKQIFVIINPHGGSQKAKEFFYNDVLPILDLANFRCNIKETSYAGAAWKLGHIYNPFYYEGILLIGGDGIVNEFINGVMSREDGKYVMALTPFCIVPCGTQNGLAKGVGTGDSNTALYSLIKRRVRHMGTIKIEPGNGSVYYSLSGFAWGVASDMVMEYEDKRVLGPLRYPYLKAKWGFFCCRPHRAKVYYVLYI